jgi:tetratricopeptide (TPR) repeat protein
MIRIHVEILGKTHMTRRIGWLLFAAVALTGGPLVVSPAGAQELTDRVRTARGSETGELTAMSPLEVTLQQQTSRTESVAVDEIRSIVFDGEPTELTQARLNARNGGYATALDRLKQIDLSKIDRDFVREDVEFFTALCGAKLALGGSGEVVEAGRKLNDFVRSHPQNFHYLEAAELMGDLLMASDKFAAAQKQYAELAKTPWPEYKTRAGVLVGRTLQAQGKHDEAIAQFDTVLGSSADNDSTRAATLGKAVSLAATEHLDDAVRMIEQVIQDTDPEQKDLQARAYNALGDCYERAGRTKDALLAYLHVDVLYSTVPEAHAEALAHLIPLWEAVGQDARAREARQVLQERYAGSRWAR